MFLSRLKAWLAAAAALLLTFGGLWLRGSHYKRKAEKEEVRADAAEERVDAVVEVRGVELSIQEAVHEVRVEAAKREQEQNEQIARKERPKVFGDPRL